MKKSLISLSIAALLGSLAFQASAASISLVDQSIARVERPEKVEKPEKAEKPEKPEKVEKQEKLGASTFSLQLARIERPEKVEKPEKAEKPEKPEKVEKTEKIGALSVGLQLAREATERPRGADNERPGDRQRRGGRNA